MASTMFSNRTDWVLSTNDISKILDRFKKEKVSYLDLTESNPTCCHIYYPPELLQALTKTDNFQYCPSPKGLDEAREAVCRYYAQRQLEVHPDDIFMTASTSEAYNFIFRLLVNPHETALFPKPSYPLFEFLTNLNDIDINYYSLQYDNQWMIDIDKLEESIYGDTQALVFVNPNNPTGSYIKAEELTKINAICHNRKLPIISDEVFFDYSLNPQDQHISLVDNQEVLTFTLGGLSKTIGLPQMKVSWIVVSGPNRYKEEAKRRLEIIADTYLSVNTPSQNALKDWIEVLPSIQNSIRQRLINNGSFLTQSIANMPSLQLLRSEGGWYATMRLSDDLDEEEFVKNLLEEKRVFVHPGYFYDFEDGNYIVLSLLPPEDVFQDGIGRFIEKIKSLG